MILGSVSYYLYTFSPLIAFLVLIISSCIAWIITKPKVIALPSWNLRTCLASIPVFFCLFSIYYLFSHPITDAIRSPWERIPSLFFWLYGFTSFLTLGFLWKVPNSPLLSRLYLFLSLGLACILFPLGFGYDPLIHQAAQEYIVQHGHIEPKTPYYLGQYVLVAQLHYFTGLSVEFLNTWLLVFLCILFLPWCLKQFLKQEQTPWTLIPLFLLFPSQALTFTTPQNLSYLFLLFTLLVFPSNRILAILLSLATASLHPITGAPLVLFMIASFLPRYPSWKLLLLSSLIIPLLFFYFGMEVQWSSLFNLQGFSHLFEIPLLYLIPNYHPLLEFIYLFGKNAWLWILSLCLASYYVLSTTTKKHVYPFFILSGIYLLNAIFLSNTTTFSSLIAYEQQDYANRLQYASLLCLVPIAFITLHTFLSKYKTWKGQIPVLLLLSMGLCTSLYLRYPKTDDYVTDRGYNISALDIQAVHWINQDAKDTKFLVIADQSIGTAAIKEFGFKRYFGPHFYYSLPTGSPLYQIYLSMAYTPEKQKEAILEAFSLVPEVQTIYFVVHKYWWGSDKINQHARDYFEEVKIFQQGAIDIYRIQKPQG